MRSEEATAHALSDGRAKALRIAEFGFAAVAVFSTTRGPIYRLGQQLDDPSDTVNNFAATFSWFALMYAVSLALLVRRWTPRPSLRRLIVLLISYHLILLLSTTWSIWRGQTFYQAVAIAGTSCLALYLGTRFSIFEVTTLVWVAAHAGLLLSLFALQRHWEDARDINDHWVGMYLNRNSFAPVLVLGIISSLALIAMWPPGISIRSRILLIAGLVGWAAIDLTALARTRSATSSFAAVGAGATVVLVLLVRRFSGRDTRPRVLSWTVLGFIFAAAAVLNFSRPWLARRAKRDLTFSGRTIIWAADREQIMRRPFQGWGWMAAWKDQTFLDRLASRGQPVFEAHSGYLEVLLGGGIVAFAVFGALLIVIVFGILDAVFRRRDAAPVVLVAFATFALVLNISETFNTAHQIPWLLLVTSGCLALRTHPVPATSNGKLVSRQDRAIGPDPSPETSNVRTT